MKQYPVRLHFEKELKKEIDKLLNMGIIEPSDAPFAHGIDKKKRWYY